MPALLAPVARQQFFVNGVPAANHKLYTYLANTTTPQATYTNRAGTVPHSNPIILDAEGRISQGLYLPTGVVYDFVFKTAADVPVFTQEDVEADPLATDLATSGSSTGAALVQFVQSGSDAVPRVMQERERDVVSVADFAGVQGAVAEAGLRRGGAYVPPGQFDVSSFSDPRGVRFNGFGQIVHKPNSVQSNWRLLNSYADSLTHDLGKEYLYAFHAAVYGGIRPKVYLYGDSTVVGVGSSAPYTPDGVLADSFLNYGLSGVSITNNGVSGQNASAWDPSAAIADADCSLLIVSYGINDGSIAPAGDAIETFYTNMAEKLATIRATRGPDSLAICIKASNSTNDWVNGRHQVWHERINGVYKRLAREFRCYFFDTYALWNDSQDASTWLDTIPYSGVDSHIHPSNLGNMWIWGELAEELVPPSLNQKLFNEFRNVHGEHQYLPVSASPDNFPYGLSMYRILLTDGWPVDGAAIVMRQADGVTIQRCVRFGSALPVVATRVSSGSSSWSAFTGAKSSISLLNGWSDYDLASWAGASYHLTEAGDVCLEGLIKPTGAIDADPILTLPVWVRPTRNRVFELSCDTGRCQVVLGSNGNLVPLTYSGTPNWVSLESVRYMP